MLNQKIKKNKKKIPWIIQCSSGDPDTHNSSAKGLAANICCSFFSWKHQCDDFSPHDSWPVSSGLRFSLSLWLFGEEKSLLSVWRKEVFPSQGRSLQGLDRSRLGVEILNTATHSNTPSLLSAPSLCRSALSPSSCPTPPHSRPNGKIDLLITGESSEWQMSVVFYPRDWSVWYSPVFLRMFDSVLFLLKSLLLSTISDLLLWQHDAHASLLT